MAEKLESISKQIHWPLLVKAALFALAWWYLPAWLFCVAAAAAYFLPPFEWRNNLPAFLALMGVTAVTPPSVLMALMYGALFYYLLLIKDFLVIDRKAARTMLAMALTFFIFREFFSVWHAGLTSGAIAWAFVLAVVFGALLDGIIFARRGKEVSDAEGAVRRLRHAAVTVSSLLLFEVLMACLFLPADFIYQSIVAFLIAALLLDLVPVYFFHELEPRRVRTTATAVFVLLVIVLASVRWGL